MNFFCTGLTTRLLVIFFAASMVRAEVFTNLHAFVNGNTADGAFPNGVTLAGGVFYGTTAQGGSANAGLIFALDTNGTAFTPLHHFAGGPTDGSSPNEPLVVGDTIYGTTFSGGTNSFGAIYRVGTNGANYTVLRSFTNSPDPGFSFAALVLGGATLYGTSFVGGSNNVGTVFKVDTNGANFAVLHHFTGNPDGGNPRARLVLNDATLYGTTGVGGSNNLGTVFKLNTNGTGYAVIFNSFSNAPQAAAPYVGLTLANNTLYGATTAGGNGNLGTVFSLGTNGANFTLIHSFTNNEGLSLQSSLAWRDGIIYGATLSRGTGSAGTVFRLATNGANFLVLKNFTNALTGANPKGPVVIDGNTVFGVANAGGPGNGGTVFRLQLAPLINSPPQALTVTNGNPASLAVSAASDSALSYQWFFNATTALAAQTNSTLNLTATTATDSGSYTVVVTDFIGSITSSPAILTVLSPPNILTPPQSLNVTNGNPAAFSVNATNGPLTYQWYFNTNNLLVGQTNNFFNLAAAGTNDAGVYTVVVANNIGASTSSPAVLTVATPKPVITVPPQSLNVTNGNLAAFSVTAVNGTLAYQWYFNTNNLLANQTNSSFTIASARTNDAGTYSVVVTNSSGSTTSSVASLTVSTNSKPVIYVPPPNLIVTNGDTAAFPVVAVGLGPLRYQWYSNLVNTALGTALAGKTNPTITLTSAGSNYNARYFTVIITNTLGGVTSSPALLTVVSAPLIVSNPSPATVNLGSTATFAVTALGTSLRYQWYSNSVNTAPGTLLANQTNNNYFFTAGTNHDGRYYSVIVTNSFGKATSSPALLTVSSLPTITLQPLPATLTNGSSLTFTSAAAGPGPLFYQWLYQTNLLIVGATNTAYTNAAQAGTYSMRVTNNFGAATSSPALLTVITLPYFTLQPSNAVLGGGSSVTFTSTAVGSGTLTYQWLYQTNQFIAGATNTTLLVTNVNQPGFYSLKAVSSYGAATSSLAQLTVVFPPTITLQPLGATITNGSSINFTAAATGLGSLGYQWLFNSNTPIAGATATNLIFVTANQPGTYSMKVTNSYGAATSSPALLTVVGRPIMISSVFDSPSGSYTFSFVNLAGSTNRLWATTNLADTSAWQAIATNVMATNGTWQFTDPQTAWTNNVRLYRFSTP